MQKLLMPKDLQQPPQFNQQTLLYAPQNATGHGGPTQPQNLCNCKDGKGHTSVVSLPLHHQKPYQAHGLIIAILDNDSISHYCPIAHLIPRDPSAIVYSNSLLHTAGGYSTDLNFWWHLQWPDHIHVQTAKAHTGDTISINSLEYAAIIINFIATTATILATPNDNDPYPTALVFTNHVTSKAWIQKGAKKSSAGKTLG